MLSQTSRYALHLLGALLAHRERRLAGQELASLTGVPANYLAKILNQLVKRGVVDSQKGWGGGFAIRTEALGMSIREVLEVFEGSEKTAQRDCAFGLATCDSDNPCPLHHEWEQIRASYTRMIDQTTVGDLAFRERR